MKKSLLAQRVGEVEMKKNTHMKDLLNGLPNPTGSLSLPVRGRKGKGTPSLSPSAKKTKDHKV